VRHTYGQTQLYLISAADGSLAVNNYMFRPVYRPSLGCTLSCYKVTIQYTVLQFCERDLVINNRHIDLKNSLSGLKPEQ